MKKYILFFILIILFLGFSNNTVSALCNFDGPVSVSIGPGGPAKGTIDGDKISIFYPGIGKLNGSVDTFAGTFTIYSPNGYLHGKMDEASCGKTPTNTNPTVIDGCVTPTKIGCTTENEYGAMSIRINMSGMYSTANDSLSNCRNQINNYKNKIDAYNSCISSKATKNITNLENKAILEQIKPLENNYDKECKSKLGPNAISSPYGTPGQYCICEKGYKFSDVGNFCVAGTVDPNESCIHTYGSYSIADPTKNGNCKCADGYKWSLDNKSCVEKIIIKETTPVKKIISVEDRDKTCHDNFGINSIWIGKINDDGTIGCNCTTGYKWEDVNSNKTKCIVSNSILRSQPKNTNIINSETKNISQKTETKKVIAVSGLSIEQTPMIKSSELETPPNTGGSITIKKDFWTGVKNFFSKLKFW